MNTCRYCNQHVLDADLTFTNAYWGGTRFPCHKSCKHEGERAEVLECQKIDADCNDCRHFQRGSLLPKTESRWINEHGKEAVVTYQPEVFSGTCLKFQKPTIAQPKKWSGHECFEHRRG